MIQLKVKTEYDFLQTYGPVKKVIAAAQGDAVAITDPNTWGHIAFYNECKKQGKKAILGVQICVVDEFTKDKQFSFMTFLAKNGDGLKELYHLISKANTNFYYVPRISYTDVAAISTNIVVICGQGHTLSKLGHREVWLNLSPEYTAWNQQAVALSKQHKLKLVVTSDVNYPALADRQAYEVLAGQFASKKTTPQHILNTLAEFKMVLKGVPEEIIREAIDNTHIIASQCNVSLPFAQTVHIEPELPIAKMCEVGLKKRLASYKKRGIKYELPVYKARLKRELELIHDKGFEDYFYLVADMVDHAKESMLVGPARGSAAGSLVCWVVGITEVDPIPFDLMFERFIDITRKDLPDIDLDFPDLKREGVIEYLRVKYGKENVAHLGTISRYKPKSAIGDVSKVLGIPAWETKDVKNAIIERSGGDARSAMCILDTFESLDIGKAFIEKYPQMKICGEIEGHARHTGVHAAGIIVCNDPVKNYCGVNKDDTAMVDKYDAEKIGMLKIDALGLRTLSVLQDCIELVGMTREELYEVPFEDKKAFDVLNSNKFAGIFQFEGYAVQTLTKQMGIEEFNDIVALTALARPGPLHCGGATAFISRRTGKEAVSYLHPLLEPYTNDTLGIVVYQEQVMAIVKNIGDFSWEETTVIRKAMSKSLGDEFFNQYKTKFITGCTGKGMKPDMADTIWKNIMTFGSWAFNKSHAVSYALVSYLCMWLKAYHPLEYAAANLANAKDEDSSVKLLRELVHEGYQFVPFDKDLSEVSWSIKDGALIGGFTSIKGVGQKTAEDIVRRRKLGVKFTPGQLKLMEHPSTPWGDIFEGERRFADYYQNPEVYNIRSANVSYIKNIQGDGHFVFLGKLKEKNQRDLNEYQSVQKRGGRIIEKNNLFLNFTVEDDTDSIICTIDRFKYQKLGKPIVEEAKIGDWYLFVGVVKDGWRKVYIDKLRRLEE